MKLITEQQLEEMRARQANMKFGLPAGLRVCAAVRTVAHAAGQIAENVAGIDQRPTDQIEAIRQICQSNQCGQWLAGAGGRCRICGCLLGQKIRNASEHCPLETW